MAYPKQNLLTADYLSASGQQTFDPAMDGPTSTLYNVIPVFSSRKAGNLTNGVGADVNGTLGTFKLNLGTDILIPARTLITGTSIIKFKAAVRRTGTDAAFLDIRFGTTNGTSDPTTNVAVQFDTAVNPQDVVLDVLISVTQNKFTSVASLCRIGGSGNYTVTSELAGLDFTVNNYFNFIVSAGTAGNYRVVSYQLEIFQ